jgi:adenylylsulfate kinase
VDTPGVVVWLTGLPSSGKSTLAERVRAELRRRGRAALILDGDAVRAALVPSPGYTPAEREGYYDTLSRLAALLAAQGLVVLVAATAHRRLFRDRARAHAGRFVEVWVRVAPEECTRRDAKGLYARARDGALRDLPGIAEEYEPPDAPEVIAAGGHDDVALARILAAVEDVGPDR